MPTPSNPTLSESQRVERLHTMKAAADILGIPLWQLRRAVSTGLVPSYAPFNSRRLVYLSEIRAAIDASKTGGA